ncbi:hypothetical protein D3C74_389970 [compost metagenome]
MNLERVLIGEEQVVHLGRENRPGIRRGRACGQIIGIFSRKKARIKGAGHIDSAVQRHRPLVHPAEIAAEITFPECQQLRILLHGLLGHRLLRVEI